MVTIAKIVEKIVVEKPFLYEALTRGIINNAALAQEIILDVEKEFGKEVKFSAVNMAIRRLGEKLSRSILENVAFGDGADVSAKSGLFSLTLYKSEHVQKKINKLYDLVSYNKGDFLTITSGVHEVMIIANNKYRSDILKIFNTTEKKKQISNLGSVSVGLSIESIDTVGLFYIVTRAINWANINIVDIVSTLTEMTFILKERDVPKAFRILAEIVKK